MCFYICYLRKHWFCIRINNIWNITAYEPWLHSTVSRYILYIWQTWVCKASKTFQATIIIHHFWNSQKRKLVLTAHWMHSLNFFFKFTVAAIADYEEKGKLFGSFNHRAIEDWWWATEIPYTKIYLLLMTALSYPGCQRLFMRSFRFRSSDQREKRFRRSCLRPSPEDWSACVRRSSLSHAGKKPLVPR